MYEFHQKIFNAYQAFERTQSDILSDFCDREMDGQMDGRGYPICLPTLKGWRGGGGGGGGG